MVLGAICEHYKLCLSLYQKHLTDLMHLNTDLTHLNTDLTHLNQADFERQWTIYNCQEAQKSASVIIMTPYNVLAMTYAICIQCIPIHTEPGVYYTVYCIVHTLCSILYTTYTLYLSVYNIQLYPLHLCTIQPINRYPYHLSLYI